MAREPSLKPERYAELVNKVKELGYDPALLQLIPHNPKP
jgi:lipocalin